MANILRNDTDGIATLTFDRPESGANLFDSATLLELEEHIKSIEITPNLRGLILISAKDSVFVAGADLKEVNSLPDSELIKYIERGQRVFARLEALKIPTVAAIHGACVGGGYEVALACKYRVASDHRSTRIGLPETQLGILPAWGGSTRLPRLIGLPAALDIILEGKTPPARKAKKLGMVDEVVPREHLRAVALEKIFLEPPPRRASALRNAILGLVLPPIVRAKLRAKTRGHYPALTEALAVAAASTPSSLDASLARERDAIERLAPGETCKNLMRLFFLTEKAKKGQAVDNKSDSTVAVIGAGVMGAGIAQWCAAQRVPVLLRDLDATRVAAGMGRVRKLVAGNRDFSPKDARDLIDRITPSGAVVPFTATGFVIEAAVERMDLKKKVFAGLEELAGPETILATNTSALSITEIASGLSDPGRVIGIHFFNPVHRMKLVEVVVGKETRVEVLNRTLGFVRKLGKLPVVVKDSPGFVVNRILMPYLLEAARFFTEGADVRDIDEAMLDFGMPMGPLRLIDEVGLDVSEDVARTLAAGLGARLGSPNALAAMLKAGLTGRKVGKGFFIYGGKGEPMVNRAAASFRTGSAASGLSRDAMADCMVALMVNEAARCLEERVVESASDIDFAMVMGTGFAPFRGGPLRHADAVGVARMVATMRSLSEEHGSHYAPCALLDKMAKENRKFYEK
jgi:3-hydroxyacyl-CoA dehydrogenase/enoyl-CoA hydratase/3-hydroxybutyryl-CoA epimerase